MSDKSRDAEPEYEESLPGEPDAPEGDAVEVDDPEALAEAEEEAIEADEDITIGEMEEGFTPDEQEAAAALAPVRRTAKAPVRKKDTATRKRSEALSEHEGPLPGVQPSRVRQAIGVRTEEGRVANMAADADDVQRRAGLRADHDHLCRPAGLRFRLADAAAVWELIHD